MEKFGFVGLPNAGKSSLYNALAGGGALAAPYAFATKDPNVGVAKVPDHRLEKLSIMSNTKSVIPASVQFVDIGGLVEGASTGEGLGNKFLANIRESDAIVFVLRAFEDDDVPGPSDPLEHLRIVETELALADLETVENQIEKRRKAAKQDRLIADEVEALGKALEILSEGTPIYRSELDAESRDLIKSYFLLTNKPVLAIVNVSVGSSSNALKATWLAKAVLPAPGPAPMIVISPGPISRSVNGSGSLYTVSVLPDSMASTNSSNRCTAETTEAFASGFRCCAFSAIASA